MAGLVGGAAPVEMCGGLGSLQCTTVPAPVSAGMEAAPLLPTSDPRILQAAAAFVAQIIEKAKLEAAARLKAGGVASVSGYLGKQLGSSLATSMFILYKGKLP